MDNSGNSDTLVQLHLGLGSFHRAHQAVYMQDLHDEGDERWSIVAGNTRPDLQDTIDALKAQGCVYTLETVTPAGERKYQKISSIKSIIDWDVQLDGLKAVVVNPKTKIISVTVTEAGYYLDEHNNLNDAYPDLKNDLEGKDPKTIYGALTVLLRARMLEGAGPITLLNCDNLRSNGTRLKSALVEFLELTKDHELLAWVNANTSSPNSMVDRITPRPTDDVSERVLEATNKKDRAPVMGESFIQWVIEDDFIAGRPAWEKVGVEMVSDVMPYEEAKIRVLNATHSCIAWAGILRGYNFIHEGTQDPDIQELAKNYVTNNVIPCLNSDGETSPVDLEKYRDVVIDRFSNPHVEDTNQRVAMDGYSKIPGFILPTLEESIKLKIDLTSVAVLPALFLAFLIRQQRGEISFTYEDQGMNEGSAKKICTATDPVEAFANDRLLFRKLAGNPLLLEALRAAYNKVNTFIDES